MNKSVTVLGSITEAVFLRDYWQKKPLLIKDAIPGFTSPINPEELAGLACEEGIESRIVIENDVNALWSVYHGPFDETYFGQLPSTHWTLLVQECQRYVPEIAQLIERFNFIPRWRIDDIMVSYAPDQGSVGPHVDQYDVFLLQGLGTRRWQIDYQPFDPCNLIPDIDLHIMRKFQADEQWILHPGDMLYLPPGLAHFGVALEDCMTLSIGFRAPSYADMLANFIDDKIETLHSQDPEPRYTDPDLVLQTHCGEIHPTALAKVSQILLQALDNTEQIHRWFGRYSTRNICADDHDIELTHSSKKQFLAKLIAQGRVYRSDNSRFAFISQPSKGCYLYVDGEEYEIEEAVCPAIMLLCDQREILYTSLIPYLENTKLTTLLTTLYNEQRLLFND